ncbi:MAG: DUF2470 domain-containing protein [Pseudomonadota bacterium]
MKETKTEKAIYQDVDDETRKTVKDMVRTAWRGSFAYRELSSGDPVNVLTGIATDVDGAPIFPMSSLSDKVASVEACPTVSLLIAPETAGDPFASARVTLNGKVTKLDGEDAAFARHRYLAKHPAAEVYIDFGDFSLWKLHVTSAHYIGGFANAFKMADTDLLTAFDDWGTWRTMEPGAVHHMNDDHLDAIEHYATHFCRQSAGAWKITGLDPEGIDMSLGSSAVRLTYDDPLTEAKQIRARLVQLAKTK